MKDKDLTQTPRISLMPRYQTEIIAEGEVKIHGLHDSCPQVITTALP